MSKKVTSEMNFNTPQRTYAFKKLHACVLKWCKKLVIGFTTTCSRKKELQQTMPCKRSERSLESDSSNRETNFSVEKKERLQFDYPNKCNRKLLALWHWLGFDAVPYHIQSQSSILNSCFHAKIFTIPDLWHSASEPLLSKANSRKNFNLVKIVSSQYD